MGLSAREASKETGKAITTITRAIETGRMSASGGKGVPYDIDPAELFRVFPPKRSAESSATSRKLHDATPETVAATGVLDLEIKMLRDMLAREQDTVTDLRARLDAAEEGRAREADERRKLTAMLTHQAASVPAPTAALVPEAPPSGQGRAAGGFWSRLWGKTASSD